MTEARHTPGPWQIDGEMTQNGAPILVANTCWRGCRRPVAKVLYFGGSEDPEVDTNARRIVACVNACEGINPDAVPELLEACKLITEGIDDIEVFDYEKGQLAVGLRAARRAIRKAEEEIR